MSICCVHSNYSKIGFLTKVLLPDSLIIYLLFTLVGRCGVECSIIYFLTVALETKVMCGHQVTIHLNISLLVYTRFG